jgi:hypothetical protein
VTVTVTAAPPPAAGPAPSTEPQAPEVSDQDPLRALQAAVQELTERFETQMQQLHELLAGAFGGSAASEPEGEPVTDRASPGLELDMVVKLYAELRLFGGSSLGGTLDVVS